MERGGTIVAEADGDLVVQNIGGHGATAGTFSPNLTIADPANFTLVGFVHTHPYDATAGWVNGVSFSGADFAYTINNILILGLAQSGPRLFAAARTAQTVAAVNHTQLNNQQNSNITARVATGRTFQQSSRIEAEITARNLRLACYQGRDGVLTRVWPS